MGKVIAEREIPSQGPTDQPAGFELVFICDRCNTVGEITYSRYPGIKQLDKDRKKVRDGSLLCIRCRKQLNYSWNGR